jgi:hypothetical protein
MLSPLIVRLVKDNLRIIGGMLRSWRHGGRGYAVGGDREDRDEAD